MRLLQAAAALSVAWVRLRLLHWRPSNTNPPAPISKSIARRTEEAKTIALAVESVRRFLPFNSTTL